MPINQPQLKNLNESAQTVFANEVVKFLCPIELEDTEDALLCDGHVLNKAIPRVSRKTVVQYADIDSFYGASIEPELIFFLALRGLPGIDVNMLFRRSGDLQVIDRNGVPVEAFFGSKKTRGFQRLELHDSNGPFKVVHVRQARFDKEDESAVVRKSTVIPDGVIDGSLLKAAYLARFEMEGYEFVKHPSTQRVRLALRDFYRDSGTKNNAREYFGPFAGCANVATPDERLGDTLTDGTVVIHSAKWDKSEIDFAITCLFRIGDELITVALPYHNGVGDPEYAARYYDKHLKRCDFRNFARLAKYSCSGFETIEYIKFQHGE